MIDSIFDPAASFSFRKAYLWRWWCGAIFMITYCSRVEQQPRIYSAGAAAHCRSNSNPPTLCQKSSRMSSDLKPSLNFYMRTLPCESHLLFLFPPQYFYSKLASKSHRNRPITGNRCVFTGMLIVAFSRCFADLEPSSWAVTPWAVCATQTAPIFLAIRSSLR